MSETPPAISVVIATYNRSAALGCALTSLVRQTFSDWEALVIGDHCTDDTADVVRSLGDCRIRFVNLPINIGEQSGPNNVGAERTSAPLVAYLNHDDLWFPQHLEVALATLHARHADLVFSPSLNIVSHNREDGTFGVIVDSLSRNGRYDQRAIDRATPASSWLVRREALERLRGWRAASECRIEPSQDLLLRAHRAGMRLWSTGVPTVISIPSGIRAGSYVGNVATEQEQLLERLDDPGLVPRLLAADSTSQSPVANHTDDWRSRNWRRAVRSLDLVGISPRVVHYTVKRRLRAGQLLDQLRTLRGLDPKSAVGTNAAQLRREAVLQACIVPADGAIAFGQAGQGTRFTASGWSGPESWGMWNNGERAELAFRWGESSSAAMQLRLTAYAFIDDERPLQRVNVEVLGRRTHFTLDAEGPHELTIDLGPLGIRPTIVAFELADSRVSPTDQRRLAIGLISATVRAAGSASR